MMISTKGRYALRVMLKLASNPEGYLSLKEVAREQEISMKYLESIMAILNRSGLVASHRGKDGGYQLARPAREISMAELLRSTEGTLSPVSCPALEHNTCSRSGDCQSLPLWKALDKRIDDYLTSVTLEDVLLGHIAP